MTRIVWSTHPAARTQPLRRPKSGLDERFAALRNPGDLMSGLTVLVWVCAVLGIIGCRSGTYRATQLPAEFAAPPAANVEEIDLSRLSHSTVPSELISRGDVLDVTVVTDYGKLPTATTPVRVGDDGSAEIPTIGRVVLAELELEDAERAIASAGIARGVYRNPHVTVTLRRRRSDTITVIGAVENPGVYRLARGSSTLLAALVSAGGLSDEAGPDVEVRRTLSRTGAPQLLRPAQPSDGTTRTELTSFQQPVAPEVIHVNLAEAEGAARASWQLQDGDVVMVSKRAVRPIRVIGLVQKPGEFEMPANQDLYVLDALALAGERTMQGADKVLIIRRVPGREEPIRIDVSVREAKAKGKANVRLMPGDVVSVEETPFTVVMSTLKSFIRFGISGSVPLF